MSSSRDTAAGDKRSTSAVRPLISRTHFVIDRAQRSFPAWKVTTASHV